VETATATADARVARASPRRFAIAGSTAVWAVLGLTAAGALIRFSALGLQSYHHDEVITAARVLPGSLGHMLHEVYRSESTPPLYYLLAWLWSKVFGLGAIGLRSLSALFGVATIPLSYLIGRELAGRRAGLLTMALAAANPMLIWYSQEARAYALLVLLCAASLLFFLRFLRTEKGSDLALWSLSSLLALATHYFAVFPVAIEAAWLLVTARPRRRLGPAVGAVATAGILLAPYALHQANPDHFDWITSVPLADRVNDVGISWLIGETGRVIGTAGPQVAYAVTPALVVAILAAFAMLGGRRFERRPARIGLVIGLGTVALPLIGAVLGHDYVLPRNLLPALLPLLAALGVAAASIRSRWIGVSLVAALVTYWLAFDLHVDQTQALQRPDWGSVVEALGPAREPRAIVTWTLGEAPLRLYLHDGSERLGPGKGPVTVREIDTVTEAGKVLARSRLPHAFYRGEVIHLGRLDVSRYYAVRPVTLGRDALRDLPTGFESNGVIVGGFTKPPPAMPPVGVRRGLHGNGRAELAVGVPGESVGPADGAVSHSSKARSTKNCIAV
jgi:mannosyltransferase